MSVLKSLKKIEQKLRSKRKKPKYGFLGDYASWDEAKAESFGYDSDKIIEKVKDSLLKVKNGEAVYERDSVLLDKKQYSWPLLAALFCIASANNNKLSLIDFGGSLGSTYFQNRELLSSLNELKWFIVEQENFVEAGKKYFEDEHLKFFFTIDSCLTEEKPNAILLSSVMQYIEKPFELLEFILSKNFEYIVFDRTAFVDSEKDIITVQKVPPDIYEASYPARFFNEEHFLSYFSANYELIGDFDSYCDPSAELKENKIYWKGFFFKRRKLNA